jgi:hypothetical protein
MSFEMPVSEPHQEVPEPKPHETEVEGRTYDVWKLLKASEGLPTEDFSLTDERNRKAVEDVIYSKYWKSRDGDFIGPSDILEALEAAGGDFSELARLRPEWAEHVEKTRNADYRKWPVLMYKGALIDGVHRFTKALADKVEVLGKQELKDLPEDALIKEE